MILWLHSKLTYSFATKSLILNALRSQGINSTEIVFTSLYVKVPDLGTYPKKGCPPAIHQRAAAHEVRQMCNALKPKLIVINDEATLRALLAEPYTLNQVRGSIYSFNDIPMMVMDQFKNVYRMNHGRFVFGWDFAKIARYAKGKPKPTPKFNFYIPRSVAEARLYLDWAKQSSFIAEDIETKGGVISCISFTFDYANSLRTICIPFCDPWCPGGAYWSTVSDEVEIWQLIDELQRLPQLKSFQNGIYDCAWLIEAGVPPDSYLLDTQGMMHSLWIESPRDLAFIASITCDNYKYWKDDNKGVEEDGWGKTHEAIEKYWRYNGLDTYYTYLATVELLSILVQFKWAIKNYNNDISLAVGPCISGSMRGLNVNKARHAYIMGQKQVDAAAALESIKRLTCEPKFNPRSTRDCAWFLYDFLKLKPTRLQKGRNPKYPLRSTDEKVLKLLKEQGDVVGNEFIRRLLEAKKPASVLSNFGSLYKLCRNGRYLSLHSPWATNTFRFNSGKSQFWTGRNAQNIQAVLREFITADPDYVLVDIDYSASDDRFIAYECEDPVKIETVESSRDSHCTHCSVFFSIPYEKIELGWKNDEDWVVAEPQGVRQITKKITHGRNYREEAGTMYGLMGRDAVVATAIALGHKNAEIYTDKELAGICQILIDKYDHPTKGLYKRIRPWQREICEQVKANKERLMTNAFNLTRKFFGDPENDHQVQRQIAAQYGQSNTAGNVNRTLRRVFYRERLDDGHTVLFLLQVHDSLVFAVHRHHLDKIGKIVDIMEEKVEIHGRQMRVPASPKVGLTWAKKMLTWHPDTTYADIEAFEEKTFGKKYKAALSDAMEDLKEILGNINLGEPGDDEADDILAAEIEAEIEEMEDA